MKNIAEKIHTSRVQSIVTSEVWPSEANYGVQNVNRNHLSHLMRGILAFIDGSECAERGELVVALYDVGDRRYCGCYIDPLYSKPHDRKYHRCYKRAQSAVTRALKKLENRGLVELIRHGRYVKKIKITVEGKMVVEGLVKRKVNG